MRHNVTNKIKGPVKTGFSSQGPKSPKLKGYVTKTKEVQK